LTLPWALPLLLKARWLTVRPYYQRAASRRGPTIVAHLQLSDTAVVVFRESAPGIVPIDLDPAYLVLRDGRWLVLFKLTAFQRPYFKLTENESQQFEQLESWFDQQKPLFQTLLSNRN
jgi:hypothetical protein